MYKPVEVAIRIRPPMEHDFTDEGSCMYADIRERALPNKDFSADYMFGIESDQDEIFDVAIKPIVQYSLLGRDVSFIAFGPSGAGKSYTMFGPGLHCTCSETNYGIIPRVVRHVFAQLAGRPPAVQYNVGIRIIEIINGQVKSLLENTQVIQDATSLQQEIKMSLCEDVATAMSYLHIAMMSRHKSYIPFRPQRSLGHCIVTLCVNERWPVAGGQKKEICCKINMVDLGSMEEDCLFMNNGTRRLSSGLITMSHLGTQPFIERNHFLALPDPVLFELLQDIMNAEVPTLVFCCLSPADISYSDTFNHLLVVDEIKNLGKHYLEARGLVHGADCPVTEQMSPLSRHLNTRPINPLVDDNALHQASLLLTVHPTTSEQNAVQQHNLTENINNNQEPNEQDGFGLQFAATQMNKLVCNAEGLFHKLLWRTELSDDFRQQIDQWMNLKQEYESCISSRSNSACEQSRVGLEKIEEVTESDDKNCSDGESSYLGSTTSSGSFSDSGESSGNESSNVEVKKKEPAFKPDFNDKLEIRMENFQKMFDRLVETTFTKVETRHSQVSPLLPRRDTSGKCGRRKSILPGEHPVGLNRLLKNDIPDCSLPEVPDVADNPSVPVDKISLKTAESSVEEDDLPYNELKLLSIGSEAKRNQLELITLDVEGLNKRMGELQHTIEIKERFIDEMMKNSAVRTGAKVCIERKHNHLESEYFKARTNLALAEKALHDDRSIIHEHKVGKYRNLAMQYERKLHNIELINQIAGDSAKKVLELESSLQNSKRKMQKLKKQVKKDQEHKLSLEQELLEDQKKMKELEEKYKIPAKVKDSRDRKQMDVDDVDTCLREDLNLEKHEILLKDKACQDKTMSKNLMQVGARINHLEQVMKEKSSTLDEAVDIETKEAVSHEIRNLRRTRDCLDEQRHSLVSKFNKDKVLSKGEERKFLECDEAIEAIDATIEYKNGLICGTVNESPSDKKDESMLLARLSKLSLDEMKSLLCKYFRKVIDLRESGRKMESQIAELDQTTEAQQLKIQSLSNALQQAHLESERKMVVAQREHQEKLHLLYRHFADDTSGHSSSGGHAEGYLRIQNKALKQRLAEVEAKLNGLTEGSMETNSPPSVTIPEQNLIRLEGSSGNTSRTTKVTRHKNKLIIQQQKTKKSSK